MTVAIDSPCRIIFFFFNDTATTEIYTLSLHDALPICAGTAPRGERGAGAGMVAVAVTGIVSWPAGKRSDRKSTRLNSSHSQISYAVFCLKKKKNRATSLTHQSGDDR